MKKLLFVALCATISLGMSADTPTQNVTSADTPTQTTESTDPQGLEWLSPNVSLSVTFASLGGLLSYMGLTGRREVTKGQMAGITALMAWNMGSLALRKDQPLFLSVPFGLCSLAFMKFLYTGEYVNEQNPA